MIDDLVERLEAAADGLCRPEDCRVAAFEIRKLRAIIKEAETLIYDSAFKLGEAHTEMTRLRMENAALRRTVGLKP